MTSTLLISVVRLAKIEMNHQYVPTFITLHSNHLLVSQHVHQPLITHANVLPLEIPVVLNLMRCVEVESTFAKHLQPFMRCVIVVVNDLLNLIAVQQSITDGITYGLDGDINQSIVVRELTTVEVHVDVVILVELDHQRCIMTTHIISIEITLCECRVIIDIRCRIACGTITTHGTDLETRDKIGQTSKHLLHRLSSLIHNEIASVDVDTEEP